MRQPFNPQPSFGSILIPDVKLNLKCRDEIIPILWALQHIYEHPNLLQPILTAVGKDVNRKSSRHFGRRGMFYWEIIVLAAVKLGCNCNYDKLQDLAENHRALRLIMGIDSWDGPVCFDWRRIRDNICKLQPETIRRISEIIVGEGHRLVPEAPESVRIDSFVVETNIHYPTDSSLLGDGLRKIITIAGELADLVGVSGWRQHEHLLKKAKSLVAAVSRASRSKAKNKADLIRAAYRPLFQQTTALVLRARVLEAKAAKVEASNVKVIGLLKNLQHFLELTEKVCDYSQRRVLLGETIPNSEKIFSMFEPHTELIRRGKVQQENQFGHNVLVVEDAAGFICDYRVIPNGTPDKEVLLPTMKELQARMKNQIKNASCDRAFHSPENQDGMAKIVAQPCLPMSGQAGVKQYREGSVEFRQARQHHPGVESAIGALQAGNGLKRSRDKTKLGYERYVGLGALGRNLHILGKTLIAQQAPDCEAAQSKRQPLRA